MRPQVLLRALPDRLLDPGIDPPAIRLLALTRKVRQRRMNHQPVPTAVRQTLLGIGQYPRTPKPSELRRRGNGGCLDAEQRHENALLATVILIRRIPDRPPCAQHLEHCAHVLALDGRGIVVVALAAASLD